MAEIKCHFEECQNRPAFSKPANLKRHVEYMHMSQYKCTEENCQEILPSRSALIQHGKEKHRLKCQSCLRGATFKTLKQLRRHIRIVHEKQKRHQSHFCNVCHISLPSKTEYQLHQIEKHNAKGSGFELHTSAMSGNHEDYRKIINSDHAPEILFSEEYYPTLVKFMQDMHSKLIHFKFNFCLTVVYEAPILKKNDGKENDEKEKDVNKSDETFRKGR